MARSFYLLCEAATLYAIIVAGTLAFLFFAGFHFTPAHLSGAQLGVIAFLIAMAPVSLVWATIGQHKNYDA